MDNFGAQTIEPAELLMTFRTHAFTIAEIAERKYRAGIVDADGRVFINSADC